MVCLRNICINTLQKGDDDDDDDGDDDDDDNNNNNNNIMQSLRVFYYLGSTYVRYHNFKSVTYYDR
jgi:hypothetical protein